MTFSRACIVNFLVNRYHLDIPNRNDWRDRVIHLYNPATEREAFLHAAPGDDRIEYATIQNALRRLGITEVLTITDLKACVTKE